MEFQRCLLYCIQRCARQPNRFAAPKPISPVEQTAFRTLVTLALFPVASGRPVSHNQLQGQPQAVHPLTQTLSHLDRQMDAYESTDDQDLALSYIPIQDIHETADRIQASNEPLPCYEDALAEALVKWFKPKFFTWVDPILCPVCESKMKLKSVEPPTFDHEKKGGAGRVEIHVCEKADCEGTVRFPRYNQLAALLESRKGRCGEFANVFHYCLKAIGLRARYVWNHEDHVWNEYYSPTLHRWIHLDSCETARDQHLLYSSGWGKKMSYCIAFSAETGATDVTRGYIQPKDWEETIKLRERVDRGSSPESLKEVLRTITSRRRAHLDASHREQLEKEDAEEEAWLASMQTEPTSTDAPPSKDGEPTTTVEEEAKKVEEGKGRQSGTKEWTEARGEGGK